MLRNFILMLMITLLIGCGNSNEAMPLSEKNIIQWMKKQNKKAKEIPGDITQVSKLTQIYKDTLDEMGYSFDATILHIIKANANGMVSYGSPAMRIYVYMGLVMSFIAENSELVVQEGFVTKDTSDKISQYLKNMNNIMDKDTLQALEFVEECQSKNDGICFTDDYATILLEKQFIKPPSFWPESKKKRFYMDDIHYNGLFSTRVNTKVFFKYIMHENNAKVHENWFLDFDVFPPFKLNVPISEIREQYGKEYWWKTK